MRDIIELWVAILLVMGYGLSLSLAIPKQLHLLANLLASVSAIAIGILFGLTPSQLGISLKAIPFGIAVAVFASIVVIIVVGAIASSKNLSRVLLHSSFGEAGKRVMAFEAAIRIPFGTVLCEEILFRGLLLGLLIQHYGTLTGLISASVLFGLWHIVSGVDFEKNSSAATKISKSKKTRQNASILGVVVVTAGAGLLFGWLRIISGGIFASWLLHTTLNTSGLAGATIAKRIHSK